ncbi:glycosyltransferase family 4 protein [Adlercreutzia sp. ZJ138]|uniref:glycosyltransferase family 4 protein n=1 Tax=Adlercreutzia sp. ZJ138 TaxID=2709405 RepID=UPI0013ECB2AA|nr:glycosyltransferase family 4 protein [Adlercreutzia sp. ZJ138]
MRILSITAQKPSSTGSGVFLTEMVSSLARAGHEQAVVFGSMPDDPPAFDLATDGPLHSVHAYPVRFKTQTLPFAVAGMSDDMPYEATRYRDFTPDMLQAFTQAFSHVIERALSEFKPDLIICHHLYIVTAVTTQLDPTCPVVGICHGTDIRQMGKHDLCNDFVCEGIRHLNRAFALTADQAELICECYGIAPERVTVLGTGYNSLDFRPLECNATERADKPTANSVLFVGKVCGKKGVPSLIRAANLLAAEGVCDLHVRLIGGFSDAEEHARIEAQAHSSTVPIELAGKVPQDELINSYQRSHVFVLPSFFEGLPLVLIEAMACGCVAVATDLPGVRPWLASVAPDAPILFVQPPRMCNVDEPLEEDLPRFERDIADAIRTALTRDGAPDTVTHLSWDALVARLMEGC